MTATMEDVSEDFGIDVETEISVQFVSEAGEAPFPPFEVPKDISPEKLLLILRAFLSEEDEKNTPYLFFVNNHEVSSSLSETLRTQVVDYESTLQVVYQPQAVFRVRGVSRCTSSLSGHGEPVVTALFSPDGRHLASGSGDKTVRFWDLTTETPHHVCKGHVNWVLAMAWSPDGKLLASGDKAGHVMIWDPVTGKARGRVLTGHKQWITCVTWEPLHLAKGICRRVASASKDGDVRVWDCVTGQCVRSMSGHTASVTCLRWGGGGLLYSASQDRTIKVWRAADGVLCRTLQGHGHWVNVLALNTDYVMRTGAFDPKDAKIVHNEEEIEAVKLTTLAQRRYDEVLKVVGEEILVSGSDDFTMFLWKPGTEKTSFARLTGHQQLVNDVKFSPCGRLIASASFDKSLRLWCGKTGRFLAVLRGHVQAVYQLAWSADSRLIVSASADSTLKLWSVENKKLHTDLPGHGDEVYTVDWSPDGQRVVSGAKDKLLRIWRN
eukprot:GFUD01026108.1.p1 GENE.GFUD01026108.1~~GFUD01026108.1.p1  ORF type:complete len:493 (+),score=112.93 GFUD01026108.1:94-1572(+)